MPEVLFPDFIIRYRICRESAFFMTRTGAFSLVHISKAITPWYKSMPRPGSRFGAPLFRHP